MTRTLACVSLCAAIAALPLLAADSANGRRRFDPTTYSRDQQARLRAGGAVVALEDVPRPDMGLVAATRTTITADRFVRWARSMLHLYGNVYVLAGARLSHPPRAGDFQNVSLSASEIDALRKCQPNDCKMKLASAEMTRIRAAIQAAGPNWRPVALGSFREVLLARAIAYIASGHKGLLPTDDHRKPVHAAAELTRLLATPTRPAAGFSDVNDFFLRSYEPTEPVETSLYWMKNAASGKEVLSLTHVAIFRPAGSEDVVVAEVQIYASHYFDASIAYFVLAGTPPERFLSYHRRTRVDLMGGAFGAIVRSIVERRARNEAPELLTVLRKRLEAGEPPADPPVSARAGDVR